MRAFLVSVDYSDLLSVTLPYNRHHFDEVTVVTRPGDGAAAVARAHDAAVFETNAFYDDGAHFNKWKALEQALDAAGREGWICLMDADVLWPAKAQFVEPAPGRRVTTENDPLRMVLKEGTLTSPLRRMCEDLSREYFHPHPDLYNFGAAKPPGTPAGWVLPYPLEEMWSTFQIHNNVNEWAGYTQIFHGSDPALPPPPWHEVNWKHAGGADSFFQNRWPRERKVRPAWQALHLGPAGANWFGRASPYLDGTLPAQEGERRRLVNNLWVARRVARVQGASPFGGEKVGQP